MAIGDYVFIDSEEDELSFVAQVVDLFNNGKYKIIIIIIRFVMRTYPPCWVFKAQ